MTRHELMSRMSSREFTGWMALSKIEAQDAKRQRDIAESGDGIVHVSGRDEPDEDDDEDDEDLDEVIDRGGESE